MKATFTVHGPTGASMTVGSHLIPGAGGTLGQQIVELMGQGQPVLAVQWEIGALVDGATKLACVVSVAGVPRPAVINLVEKKITAEDEASDEGVFTSADQERLRELLEQGGTVFAPIERNPIVESMIPEGVDDDSALSTISSTIAIGGAVGGAAGAVVGAVVGELPGAAIGAGVGTAAGAWLGLEAGVAIVIYEAAFS